MNKVLWFASLKARVLAASPLAMDGSEFMFGECATFSNSQSDMVCEVFAGLGRGKLELVELLHISPLEGTTWMPESEDREAFLRLIDEVRFSGEFSFGVFRSSRYLGFDK